MPDLSPVAELRRVQEAGSCDRKELHRLSHAGAADERHCVGDRRQRSACDDAEPLDQGIFTAIQDREEVIRKLLFPCDRAFRWTRAAAIWFNLRSRWWRRTHVSPQAKANSWICSRYWNCSWFVQLRCTPDESECCSSESDASRPGPLRQVP